MTDLDNYCNLGIQLAHARVSTSNLEQRINQLTLSETPALNQEQTKSLVTGFVDTALADDERYNGPELHAFLLGFARFLYNGKLPAVHRAVLLKIARTGKGVDLLKDKNDLTSLAVVGEFAWATRPELTLEFYHGPKRKELLSAMAKKYFEGKIYIPQQCFKELGDILGLRRHALAHLKDNYDYAKQVLEEHGTDDDLREAVKFWHNRCRVEQFGGENNDPVLAYDWAMRIKAPTPEDTELIKKLKTVMIKKCPERAMERFSKQEAERSSRTGHYEYVCIDKEGAIAVGMQYLGTGRAIQALEAFALAEYNGPEIMQAGLSIIKQFYETKIGLSRDGMGVIENAAKKAVHIYLEKGGSILAVESMINYKTCGDDLNRRCGKALSENSPARAYERFMSIKDKKLEDNAEIAELRKKIVDGDRSIFVFEEYNDREGMQLHIEQLTRNKRPDSAYEIALKLGDEAQTDTLRHAMIKQDGAYSALRDFQKAKDEKGIQLAREKISTGIPAGIVDTLLNINPKTEN